MDVLLKKLDHIAIICSDYATSKHFYTEVLGFKVIREEFRAERRSYKLDLALEGQYLIELFSFPKPPQRPTNPEACGLRHLAFEVDDLDETIDFLKQHGVPTEPLRFNSSLGQRSTFVKDPDGLPIELVEFVVNIDLLR